MDYYTRRSMDLLQRTYELIDGTALTYREIAAGAGVDVNWFAKFKQKRIRSPGVPKVQAVHDFLLQQSLQSHDSDHPTGCDEATVARHQAQ